MIKLILGAILFLIIILLGGLAIFFYCELQDEKLANEEYRQDVYDFFGVNLWKESDNEFN